MIHPKILNVRCVFRITYLETVEIGLKLLVDIIPRFLVIWGLSVSEVMRSVVMWRELT